MLVALDVLVAFVSDDDALVSDDDALDVVPSVLSPASDVPAHAVSVSMIAETIHD